MIINIPSSGSGGASGGGSYIQVYADAPQYIEGKYLKVSLNSNELYAGSIPLNVDAITLQIAETGTYTIAVYASSSESTAEESHIVSVNDLTASPSVKIGTIVPIEYMDFLNDLKTWGEESFVYQNKDILHALYKNYSLSINDPFFNQDVWEYVLNGGHNQTDVGRALSYLSGLSSSVKTTLQGFKTLRQVLSSETVMDALAENETAVTLFGYIKHYDRGAYMIGDAVIAANIHIVFKHGNLANALLLSDDGTYTNTDITRAYAAIIRNVLKANDVEGWTYLQQCISEGYSSNVYGAIINAAFLNEYLAVCTNSKPLYAIAEYVNANYTDTQVRSLYNSFRAISGITETSECGGATKHYLATDGGAFRPVFIAIYQTRGSSYTGSYTTYPYMYYASNQYYKPCTLPKNDNNEQVPYREVATTDPADLKDQYMIGLSFIAEYSLYMNVNNTSYSRYAVYILDNDDWHSLTAM